MTFRFYLSRYSRQKRILLDEMADGGWHFTRPLAKKHGAAIYVALFRMWEEGLIKDNTDRHDRQRLMYRRVKS